MNCKGYPTEIYGLYILGLLEEAEAAELRSHLESACPECCREVRAAASLWFLVGVAQAEEDRFAKPSADLRRRILEGAGGRQAIAWWARPGWRRLGAVAAGLFICTAVWFASRSYNSRQPLGNGADSAAVAEAQAQVREWRSRAEAAERKAAELQTSPAPVTPAPPVSEPGRPVTDPSVSAQLAEALATNRNLEETLGRERNRASALEAELASQRVLLATAQQQKNDADKRAESANEDRARLAAREERVAALAAQVQDLERQNATYRETVTRLQREFDRNVRLVAFLSAPSLRMVNLAGTEAASQAQGHAFILDNQKVLFYAANLPPLPPGRTYQLWIMKSKGGASGIMSAGVARPDNSRRMSLEFENGTILRDINALAVTEEPAGGSPLPTGHKVLYGGARS